MLAFNDCTSLSTVSFPLAETIYGGAFSHCESLTSVEFPKVSTIKNDVTVNSSILGAFNLCTGLTNVSFPVATSIGDHAFYGCEGLTNVSFPAATDIRDSAFYRCEHLTSVSLPVATNIKSYAFEATRLTTLYLGTESNTVCTLSSTNAIPSHTITKIYVPFLLVDKYKTATNWSSFSSKIAAYDEPVECVSLSITAEDVPWYATTATVHVAATCKYNLGGVSQGDSTKVFTWDDTSVAFAQNLEESSRNVTVSFEFLGVSASTTIVQDKYRTDLVGGTIFYIDSSADGVYEFYDKNGELISNVAVGDKPYSYKVITPGSKDKYYVYHDNLYRSLRWTYYKDGSYVYTNMGTGDAIGTGKSNTATVLAADNGAYATADSNGYPTIWYKLQQARDTSSGGCNDWFIPSQEEANEVRKAALTPSWFNNRGIWSSSESSARHAIYWESYSSAYATDKDSNRSVFFARAF